MGGIDPQLLLASLMVASTAILLAALGELVVERAGVLNLGVEGMMITGAICGFVAAVETGSPGLGFVVAALAGAALAMLFGVLTQLLLSNQVATGLALTLFGLGLSALIGQSYTGIKAPQMPEVHVPLLADLPWLGPILFRHDIMVYVSLGLVLAVWAVLRHTRAGLILRAVGENHDAAHALGYRVVAIRLAAIAFGGALAGLGGAYISLVRVPQWTEGMTAGAGWIALAIVVFAAWRPGRVLVGAYLFGGITVLQLNLQAAGIPLLVVLPWLVLGAGVLVAVGFIASGLAARQNRLRQALVWFAGFAVAALVIEVIGRLSGRAGGFDTLLLSSSPFLVTILVLVLISGRGGAAGAAPGSLTKPFHATS